MDKVTLNCDDFESGLDCCDEVIRYSPKNEIICTNPTGYCVDSVEPKCNEIKRLIHEFKTSYLIKLNMIKHNRTLMHRLNAVEETYVAGVSLLNRQALTNVNPEKARHLINEIDDWLDQVEKLELHNYQHCIESNHLTTSLSFLTIDQINRNSIETPHLQNMKEEVLKSLDVKREKLCKDIETSVIQLKALRDSFNKRRHNLLKACHKPLSKSVQRTESMMNDNDLQTTPKLMSRKSVHRSASFKVSNLNTVRFSCCITISALYFVYSVQLYWTVFITA